MPCLGCYDGKGPRGTAPPAPDPEPASEVDTGTNSEGNTFYHFHGSAPKAPESPTPAATTPDGPNLVQRSLQNVADAATSILDFFANAGKSLAANGGVVGQFFGGVIQGLASGIFAPIVAAAGFFQNPIQNTIAVGQNVATAVQGVVNSIVQQGPLAVLQGQMRQLQQSVVELGNQLSTPEGAGKLLGGLAADIAWKVAGGAIAQKAGGLNAPGKRRQNRLPDTGEPGSVVTNKSGTTTRKYGPNGQTQKDWNRGHDSGGGKTPSVEQKDHVHDYKPNPNNPSGRPERMPGRPPRPRDLNDLGRL
jgi:hypothetical protein